MQILSNEIRKWYLINKRDLPWREIQDPYLIWISEIILQQTRVNQGLSYYQRFVSRFPTLKDLAQAELDEVLKYWQGLGYYSRARNLYKSAKVIIDKYNGVFPTSYDDILNLPGIGVYTASAICSFAYNIPYPVIDGNVYRVLSRLFGIHTAIDTGEGKKQFMQLALDFLNTAEPALHNQAIMEFGALQCIPVSPDCGLCPLIIYCKANEYNQVGLLPVKSQKIIIKERFFNYLFIQYHDKTLISKRVDNDIWKNLYEFPLIESDRLFNYETLISNEEFQLLFSGIDKVEILNFTSSVRHVLTHRIIYSTFIKIRIEQKNIKLEKFIETSIAEIVKFPVSKLMEKFLKTITDYE